MIDTQADIYNNCYGYHMSEINYRDPISRARFFLHQAKEYTANQRQYFEAYLESTIIGLGTSLPICCM